MKQAKEFFEDCPEQWRDGYLISVRSRLSNMLEREYLPKDMKNAYLDEFGEEIVFEDDFIDWYCTLKKSL